MPLTSLSPDLAQALAAALPDGVVGPVPPAYLEEPRGRYAGASAVLARPNSVEEVADILRFAAQHRVGVVPYAGGTGLVGGQVAEGAATILLSVERLSEIEVDPVDMIAVVGAGAILKDVQTAAEAVGRLFPLSLASEGSARIGGLLGTNAGGTAVVRYGNARELCLGIEAVLADGSILRGLKRLRKDNTGYDLRNLLIGSEGTLGVITAAALRLFPRSAEEATALVSAPSPQAALDLLQRARAGLGEALSGFEIMHVQGLAFLGRMVPDAPQAFDPAPEWTVLIDVGSGPGADVLERLQTILASAIEAGEVGDALIAQNQTQAAAFWAMRERIPEANRLWGAIASHDISVPIARVPAFIEAGRVAIAAYDPDLLINCFGHLADGNLHYNVFPPEPGGRAAYDAKRGEISRLVHDLVHAHDGSISAEHGIGRLKTADLERYGDPVRLAAMRAVKSALDPAGILNPGAVLKT